MKVVSNVKMFYMNRIYVMPVNQFDNWLEEQLRENTKGGMFSYVIPEEIRGLRALTQRKNYDFNFTNLSAAQVLHEVTIWVQGREFKRKEFLFQYLDYYKQIHCDANNFTRIGVM